jgi:cell division protein FtsQ
MSRVNKPGLCAPRDLRARTAERARNDTQKAMQKANCRRGRPRWVRAAVKAGLIALPVVMMGGAGTWAYQTGWFGMMGDKATAALLELTVDAGLEVQEVLVEGRNETDRAAVMAAIQVKSGDPIMKFDPEVARAGLERLRWVATATVERRLPNTVFVKLDERRPMALWQRDGKLALIDRDGEVLTERELGRYNNLLQIIGADAPKHAQELLGHLGTVPTLFQRVNSATRIGGRRWDLRLTNGVVIRLPESDIGGALHHLVDQEAKQPVLDRDIVAVDLRLPDRLVIQTSATAAQRRRAPEQKI